MPPMYATESKERYAYLIYGSYILVITGKEKEAINLEGINTIEDLISKLDKKYPGLKDIFIPQEGMFNSRTAITVRRLGEPSVTIINKKQEIKAGDTVFLW